MASSIASPIHLGNDDGTSLEELDGLKLEVHIPKQTSIDKIGGIFCHICNSVFGNKKIFDKHYSGHNTGCKEIVYTCVECKMKTSSYQSFRGHCYLRHVVMNKFQCQHCPKKFNKPCLLNYHIAALHNHDCPACKDKFTSKRDLEIHKKLIHDQANMKGKSKPPYDCLLCDTIIKTADTCESHIDNHCEMLYPCPICKEVQPNKLAAMKHMTKHFDEKLPNKIPEEPNYGEDSSIDILGGILCYICDVLCRNREEIEFHFTDKHQGVTVIYTCNACKKPCEKYELFGSHCYDHFAKGKFQCDQCDKSFSRLSRLVIHTEAFHTDCLPDKPFGCEKCGHSYMTSARLKEHLRVVHEEDGCRSRCMKPGCSAIFDKPRDLIQHLKNHNPMLDNWCKQCGLQFTTLSSAEKHLDVHRTTQYSCPICKRTYQDKWIVVKHVPVHFEATLHICTTCGKSYTARRRLIQHLKTHSETHSYKCTHCNKSFMKPHQLKQHLNTHTGHKPYSCTLCPKTFTNYSNWSKHLSRMHFMDKAQIKKLHAELKTESVEEITTSPSTIEPDTKSAKSKQSKLFDVCSFADSEDSADTDWSVQNLRKNLIMREIKTSRDSVTDESINDMVKAVICSLDENLDEKPNNIKETQLTSKCEKGLGFITVNITEENINDEKEIEAIVEDIDAMSRGMGGANHEESTGGVSEPENADSGILTYAEMMPVDESVFNTISEEMCTTRAEEAYQSCCLPEPGPDFPSDGSIDLDDHILPHIDPLLTIKTGHNAKMYVQNLNNYNFDDVTTPNDYGPQDDWAMPIITKVFRYEENNDVNNMYIY